METHLCFPFSVVLTFLNSGPDHVFALEFECKNVVIAGTVNNCCGPLYLLPNAMRNIISCYSFGCIEERE